MLNDGSDVALSVGAELSDGEELGNMEGMLLKLGM
jgi:hypothetical protein